MSREQITGKHALIDPTRNGYTVGATTRIDWAKVPDNAEFKDEKGEKFIPEFTFMGKGADGVYPLSSGEVLEVTVASNVGTLNVAYPNAEVNKHLVLLGEIRFNKYAAEGYKVISTTGNTKLAMPNVADATYDIYVVPVAEGMTQHAYTEGDVRNNHDNIALYTGGGFYENRLPQFTAPDFLAFKKAFELGATWVQWATYRNSLEDEALPIEVVS